MTYDEILNRCLEKVPDDIDVREGSFMYTAIAPVCFELSNAYFEMQNMLDLAFVDTSYEDYLDKVAVMVGVTRYDAVNTQKIAEIICNGDIIGEKFSCDEYLFEVISNIDGDNYVIRADEYNSSIDNLTGDLYSIMNLTTVESATIVGNYILSSAKEDDETLRARIKEKLFEKPFGGNVSDYKDTILERDAISYAHIFTGYDAGASNVRVIIAGADKTKLDDSICDQLELYFNGDDENIANAPIGHNVSVSSCDDAEITVECTVECVSGANFDNVSIGACERISEYISELGFENDTISIMKIVACILDDDTILDVSNVLINGLSENFKLVKSFDSFEVAKISDITINQL